MDGHGQGPCCSQCAYLIAQLVILSPQACVLVVPLFQLLLQLLDAVCQAPLLLN